MTSNTILKWSRHALDRCKERNVDNNSIRNVINNPIEIQPDDRHRPGRERIIGIGLKEGTPYPILVSVSAGTNGDQDWLAIKTVYPYEKYKKLLDSQPCGRSRLLLHSNQ